MTRDVQNAFRLGLQTIWSRLDTSEAFKRLRVWQNVYKLGDNDDLGNHDDHDDDDDHLDHDAHCRVDLS